MKLKKSVQAVQVHGITGRPVAEVELSAGLEVRDIRSARDPDGDMMTHFDARGEQGGWYPHWTVGALGVVP